MTSSTSAQVSGIKGLALGLFLLLGAVAGRGEIIWVGSGGAGHGCDAATLGDAVTLANWQAGEDEIRLARDIGYFEQVTVDAADSGEKIVISGGWEHCEDAVADGRTEALVTLEVLGSGSLGSHHVVLRDLDVQFAGAGAGVALEDGARVELENVLVHGGGIGVQVSDGAEITIDGTSEIFGNVNDGSGSAGLGGGVRCGRSHVPSSGGRALISGKIHHNEAKGGAGLAAMGTCYVELREGARIYDNRATTSFGGGGIYADSGAIVFNDGDLLVHGNSAADGGGIRARDAGTLVALGNAGIFDNFADDGGGVHVSEAAHFLLTRTSGYACPNPPRCSWISDNLGVRGIGVFAEHPDTLVQVRQTFVENNEAFYELDGCVFRVESEATVILEGLQLWRNVAPVQLCAYGNGSLEAGFVSAARNFWESPKGPAETYLAAAFGGGVNLYSSVFDDTAGALTDATGEVNGDCLIIDDATGLSSASLVTVAAEPGFFHPDGGILHLRPDSEAIDYCDTVMYTPLATDVDLDNRGFDDPGHEDFFGPWDLGFDEYVASSAPGIFADGFESGGSMSWSATRALRARPP